MNFNKLILAGNITRDIELKYTPGNPGTAVADFGLAVNRKYTKKDGGEVDEVCFIDVVAFGKTAETIDKYLGKGDPILAEGRLSFEQWTGQSDRKYSKHKMIVENFQFLPKGEKRQEPEPEPTINDTYDPDNLDDCPF